MINIRTYCLSAALAVVACGLPVMASAAAPAPDVSEVTVQTGDLDLGTARGLAMLQQRIRAASMTVCKQARPLADETSDVVRACRIKAIHDVEPAVQSEVRLAAARKAVSLEASAVPR